MPTLARTLIAALMLSAAAAASLAQPYPSRPIRYVVPFPPGGSSDNVARVVAQRLTESFGQPTIIENKPGAGALIGAEFVAKAAPDGYTLLNTTTGVVAIAPQMGPAPYDPLKDFQAVAMVGESYGALAIHPSVPAKNLAELIAFAKANPGKLNFGSAGPATITHLYGELFMLVTGIQIVHVPYKGSALALNDLIAGQIQMQFDPVTIPHIRAGKLVGIASTASTRVPILPDLPTMAEGGLPEFNAPSWFGVLAPARTPREIVDRIAGEIERMTKDPAAIERMRGFNLVPIFKGPDAFAAQIRTDYRTYGEIIRKANLR